MIGGGALIASIAAALIMRIPSDPPPAPLVAPVANITVSPAAPVVVPVPITITPPAPPPPAPEPAPAPIRASTPFLQTQCVLDSSAALSCAWDRGFPAISADGQTMVYELVADDGGRGYPNLTITFVDVATSKVKKSVRILDSNEYDPENPRKLEAKIEKRVRNVHKLIEAGGYHSLQRLPHLDEVNVASKLRVDSQGGVMRIVDTEQQRAIYQASFESSVVFPDHKDDVDADCSGMNARELTVSWDEQTRMALVTVLYMHGGCMCGSSTKVFVRHVK